MAELQSRVDHLQQENDRLWARLEEDRGENARGSSHLAPPVKQNKGKEPTLPGNNDAVADDELSSGSSPLPDLPPPRTTWRLNKKRGPRAVPAFPLVACLAEYEEKSAERGTVGASPRKYAHVAQGRSTIISVRVSYLWGCTNPVHACIYHVPGT